MVGTKEKEKSEKEQNIENGEKIPNFSRRNVDDCLCRAALFILFNK